LAKPKPCSARLCRYTLFYALTLRALSRNYEKRRGAADTAYACSAHDNAADAARRNFDAAAGDAAANPQSGSA
jgi:hypothetical protein